MRGWRRLIVWTAVFLFLPLVVSAQNPPSGQSAPATQTVPPESTNKKKPSSRHQHDFLIKGTVFTEEGLSFAGARIQIRKAGQKSYRWKDVANSRGEFAIRVVQGAQYEVSVSGKGSAEQKKTVDATGSDRVEELVFHMEREGSKPS
jgi:hypothetical protein